MKLFLLPEMTDLVFERVFGNTVVVQALRFWHKVRETNEFVLSVPFGLADKIKDLLAKDLVLQPLTIAVEELSAETLLGVAQDPACVPLHRLYYSHDEYLDVGNLADMKNLRGLMVKGIRARTGTFVARHINKWLSLPLSQSLAWQHVKPNVITLIAIVWSLLGGFCLLSPNFTILGFVCFQINSLLDGCDGEVAWINMEFSAFGKKLDVYGDYLTTVVIIVFEGAGFYFMTGRLWVAIVAGFSVMTLVCIGLVWLSAVAQGLITDNMAEIEGLCHERLRKPQTKWDKLHAVFLFVSRRDFYILVLLLLACFKLFVVIHLFIFACTVAWLMLSLYTMSLLRKAVV